MLIYGKKIKKVVIGCFEQDLLGKTYWENKEVIIKKKAKRPLVCHECGKIIQKGEEYYSDRIGYLNDFSILGSYKNFHTHLICEKCWKGEILFADGDFIKFVDKNKPKGKKTVIKPLKKNKREW